MGRIQNCIQLSWSVNRSNVEGLLRLPALLRKLCDQSVLDGFDTISFTPLLARFGVDREFAVSAMQSPSCSGAAGGSTLMK